MIDVLTISDLAIEAQRAARQGKVVKRILIRAESYKRFLEEMALTRREDPKPTDEFPETPDQGLDRLEMNFGFGGVPIVASDLPPPGTMIVEWYLPLRPHPPGDEQDDKDQDGADRPADGVKPDAGL